MIQINMPLPENCMECRFAVRSVDKIRCVAKDGDNEIKQFARMITNSRSYWCPLVEVPSVDATKIDEEAMAKRDKVIADFNEHYRVETGLDGVTLIKPRNEDKPEKKCRDCIYGRQLKHNFSNGFGYAVSYCCTYFRDEDGFVMEVIPDESYCEEGR